MLTRILSLGLVGVLATGVAVAQPVEKQHVLSITAEDLKAGLVSEITWDGGLLVIQGAFVAPSGEIKAQYFVMPADGTEVRKLTEQSQASLEYWQRKSNRRSPTGVGEITASTDRRLPMYGVGSHDRRLRDAVDMGGVQQRHVLLLGSLILLERTSDHAPYDGETYSWSPAMLNRIAYVDGKGDLWVARSNGTRPERVLKGDFTLPAWSDDGRMIAIAERKEGGRRWDVSVVLLPEALRTPPR